LSTYVQLPVGVAIYLSPALAQLSLVRFAYFITALALIAVAYGRGSREDRTGDNQAAENPHAAHAGRSSGR
jgi:hypothetical protein